MAVGGMLKQHLAPESLEKLLRAELMPVQEEEEDGEKLNLWSGLLKFVKGGAKDGAQQ